MRHIFFIIFVTVTIIASVFAQPNTVLTQDKFGQKLVLQMNSKTGSAHRVSGHLPKINNYGFQSENLNQTQIENFSDKFFIDYSNILKINLA